jgi:tricorn protease
MPHARSTPAAALGALIGVVAAASASAEAVRPDATMLQYPDVSATDIVFVYANDLWLVPRTGGTARKLASPQGREGFPKFSPDGRTIAFMGNYDGNTDLYTIPADGAGVAFRVTHHPTAERLTDWTPDGDLMFHASGFAGLGRMQTLHTVGADGGLPEKLPVPYGANGAISPDGTWLAYSPHQRDFRTWKRYRGGMATDIWLFNLDSFEWRPATDWEGTDTLPMWHGSTLYYLSDAGPAHRLNIWSYEPSTGRRDQVTFFEEFDVKWPSIGPGTNNRGEIVFQNGPSLHLLDLTSGKSRPIEVIIPGDRPSLRATSGSTSAATSPAGTSRPRATASSSRPAATSGRSRRTRASPATSPAPAAWPSAAPSGPPTGAGSPTSRTRPGSTRSTSPSPTARARPAS